MPALAALSLMVSYLAHHFGVAVELLDARVDDLDRGCDVVGGIEHLFHGHVWSAQFLLEDEGQLHFDTRGDEIFVRDVQHLTGRAGVEHVVQQGAVVGLVDLAGDLHGAAGEADLVADHGAAFGELDLHPGAVDAVAVFDGNARKALGEVLDLHAGFFGLVQLVRELLDQCVIKHGHFRNRG